MRRGGKNMTQAQKGGSVAKWVMLVAGVLTCTMIYPALAPEAALAGMYGEAIAMTDLSEIIVRNWGVLITLVGAMLIYGAFHPPVRGLVLTVAIVSKLTFIGLTLWLGARFLNQQVGVALAVDAVMVALFAVFLFAPKKA
jgi:hypothetical protein